MGQPSSAASRGRDGQCRGSGEGRADDDAHATFWHPIGFDIEINSYPEPLREDNAAEILGGYDFVLDCTDSMDAKLLLGDAAFAARKPLSHAGVLRFGGQAMRILHGRSACLRCVISKEEIGRRHVPCSEAGVLGPVAGIMGSIQATEAIKYIAGVGDVLTDALPQETTKRTGWWDVKGEWTSMEMKGALS